MTAFVMHDAVVAALCNADFCARHPGIRDRFYILDGQLVAWPD